MMKEEDFEDWKANIKRPEKDMRYKTAVNCFISF